MFSQEIRWRGVVWWALVGLLLGTTSLSLVPAFSATDRELRKLPLLIVAVTTGAVLLVLWIFGTLRISVNQQVLTVGFGPFRERISLDRVAACGVTTYRWMDWGGFGIRVGRRGKLYNVPGDRGIAVQVDLKDGQKILFSSPDPSAVCHALRQRNPEITEL
jgi:hypothetical protein